MERQQAASLGRMTDPPPTRLCDWPDCSKAGDYKAPRSRANLRDFHHFCLEHVREYNSNWDYFKNMSAEEIEAYRRADVTWHRPSWRFGTAGVYDIPRNGFRYQASGPDPRVRDPFGFFEEHCARHAPPPREGATSQERQMMLRLGLDEGFSLAELKESYKRLVKQHHPDLHGGDKAAEERLKLINEAYSYLTERQSYA